MYFRQMKLSSIIYASIILKFFYLLVMVARPRLAVQERMRVVVCNEEGYSLNSKAARPAMGRRTVQEIVEKYTETGEVQDRLGKGEIQRKVQEKIERLFRAD